MEKRYNVWDLFQNNPVGWEAPYKSVLGLEEGDCQQQELADGHMGFIRLVLLPPPRMFRLFFGRKF